MALNIGRQRLESQRPTSWSARYIQRLFREVIPDRLQYPRQFIVVSGGQARPHLDAELPDSGQQMGVGGLPFLRQYYLVAAAIAGEAFAHCQLLARQLVDDAGDGGGIFKGAVGQVRLGGRTCFIQLVEYYPLFGGDIDAGVPKGPLKLCLKQAGRAVQYGTDIVVR